MEMNNMYGTMNGAYGMGYDPNMVGYYNNNPAMGYVQNTPMPTNQSTLTPEEAQSIKAAPTNKINIAIEHNDVVRSMCNHKNNGLDLVQRVGDGSGDVYCPLCGERWNPDLLTKEEIIDLINQLINQMQSAKWVGDLPTELVREYFTMIPLLKKYPDIHEYAMNTFNKYYNANGMVNAQDANVYSMYNSLMGGVNPYAYQQPNMGGYMNQPTGYYGQQAAMGGQMGGYNPAMMGQAPVAGQANPMVNPMQASPYGVNPNAANQQFVNQANMMMQGSVYGQAQQPNIGGYNPAMMGQQMQNPVFGATQQGQAQQPPQANATQPAADPNTSTGPVITGQADGTVKSESKISL